MSINLIASALSSAVRAATVIVLGSTLTGSNISGQQGSGLTAYLNVSAVPGTDTVQLVLEEQDPTSGVWTAVAATTATAVTGLVTLKLGVGIAAIAATTTAVAVNQILPAIWRIRVVHSAGTNFTYSLGVVVFA